MAAHATGGTCGIQLKMWNYQANAWKIVHTATADSSDGGGSITYNLRGLPSDYIHSTTDEVKARLVFGPGIGSSFTIYIDQVQWATIAKDG